MSNSALVKSTVGLLIMAVTITSKLYAVAIADAHYLVTAYGAVGDGKTLNTVAIQKTIDECSAKGGGTVDVPEGTFLTGSIFFRKGVTINIARNAVLKGSVNPDDYPQITTGFEGVNKQWTAALVNAQNLSGIGLTGEGKIDGSGEEWIAVYKKITAIPKPGKPRLICFENCNHVYLSKLNLTDQAVWCVHLLNCSEVVVDGLTIRAQHNIPSSDGIDIDSSDHILVKNCDIDVNDDCISIKAGRETNPLPNKPCHDIIIEHTRFGYGHGGVAMGSETSGGINHVEVRDCIAEAGNWAPVRFKTQPSRGGVVEEITFRNFQLKDVNRAFEMNMAWNSAHGILAPASKIPAVFRRIRLINVSGTAKSGGVLSGLANSPIAAVSFKDCTIEAQTGIKTQNVTDIDYSGLKLTVKEGETIINQ